MINPDNHYEFQNWGETLSFKSKHYYKPKNEDEIRVVMKIAKEKGLQVRIAGSGHSWTHLLEAENQILVSLENYQGIINVNKETKQATVKSGTKLNVLGEALEKNGLAMINLGDINKQAVAGALGTGTHGTGTQYGVIPTQVIAMRIVTVEGEIIECSETQNREIFKAAQVSLGSLGVVSTITLQCVDLYNLHLVKKKEKLHDVLSKLDKHNSENRNFELYWFPYTNVVQTKYSNETKQQPNTQGFKKWFLDVFLENNIFKGISEVSRIIPATSASMAKLCATAITDSSEINVGHKIYATPRLVKFKEMEYGVPAEKGAECLLKIKEFIEKEKIQVHFPLEFRFVKGDDILISPAHGYDTCFISCHMYLGMPYEKYFAGCENVFLSYKGRPHWGKMHTQKADYFQQIYPKWNEFLKIRQQLDPQGLLLNNHLREVFGIN